MHRRVKKLVSFSETQIEIYRSVVVNYCLLDEGITNQTVHDAFNNSYGAHGFNAIIYQLIQAIIKDCCEILFSSDARSPSAQVILDRLKCNALHDYFCDSFAKPLKQNWSGVDVPAEIKERIKQKRNAERSAERRQVFITTLHKTRELFDSILCDPVFKKIKKTRNKVISHFEVRMVDDVHTKTTLQQFDIKWDDLEYIVKQTELVVSNLNLLITNSSFSTESVWEYAQLISTDYWQRQTTS